MKVQFKIYNIDIVDCSSCYNSIFPNPESREILLEMILRVCESEVISRIGQFKFWLDEIELQSPNVSGHDSRKEFSRHELQSGTEAEVNKLSGLYVEAKEDALKRIKEPSWASTHGLFKCTKAFYLEPGLIGIKQGIRYIRALYNNQREGLPDYIKNMELKHFGFSGGVIWKMDDEWRIKDGFCDYISYEHDTIGGSSTELGMGLGFGNFGGDSSDIYTSQCYLDHLNAITEIIDDIAPGRFIAGPDEMLELLEFDILKKEGRKLVAGDEESRKENLERFDTTTFVRSLDTQSEVLYNRRWNSLLHKISGRNHFGTTLRV